MKLRQFKEAVQKDDFAVGDSFWIGAWEFEVVNTRKYKDEYGSNISGEAGFDEKGKCLKCGSRVSFADVTDTLVYVGDEIIKRYEGDITNRNCVRCMYPGQYPDYEDYDDGEDDRGGNNRRCDGEKGDSQPSPSYCNHCVEVDEKMGEQIKSYQMVIELSEDEFEMSMGRRARSQDEFDEWARLVEKGLFNGHIDWDILHECACEAMLHSGEGGE